MMATTSRTEPPFGGDGNHDDPHLRLAQQFDLACGRGAEGRGGRRPRRRVSTGRARSARRSWPGSASAIATPPPGSQLNAARNGKLREKRNALDARMEARGPGYLRYATDLRGSLR
jgi:hypothetical protein